MPDLDLGRVYVWILFVVSVLTAAARLGLPGQFAVMMSAKLADERKRRWQRLLGWLILAGSPVILLYGWLFTPRISAWVWAAAGLGALNGVEQLLNVAYPDRASLTFLSRVFGAFQALAAILIWFLVLRYPAVR